MPNPNDAPLDPAIRKKMQAEAEAAPKTEEAPAPAPNAPPKPTEPPPVPAPEAAPDAPPESPPAPADAAPITEADRTVTTKDGQKIVFGSLEKKQQYLVNQSQETDRITNKGGLRQAINQTKKING